MSYALDVAPQQCRRSGSDEWVHRPAVTIAVIGDVAVRPNSADAQRRDRRRKVNTSDEGRGARLADPQHRRDLGETENRRLRFHATDLTQVPTKPVAQSYTHERSIPGRQGW
jgi:hypothetical protein